MPPKFANSCGRTGTNPRVRPDLVSSQGVGIELWIVLVVAVIAPRIGGRFRKRQEAARWRLPRARCCHFVATQSETPPRRATHFALQSDAGGGTRTPDTRIMMTAKPGPLSLTRHGSGAVKCPQFGSKSGVGRTVGRTVWARSARRRRNVNCLSRARAGGATTRTRPRRRGPQSAPVRQ